MHDFETEDQQIEALKKWWNENGTSLIVGLGLGIAVLFGGRYYMNMQKEHSASAGDLYFLAADQMAKNNESDAQQTTSRLITEYSDTPYAALASLIMARYEFELGKTDEAVNQLKWVMNNADQDELVNVARLRLARIYLGKADYDATEALLYVKRPEAFDGPYEELKGDYFVAKGQLAEARTAYDKAIKAMGVSASGWLRLKRQDLGEIELDTAGPVEPPA